MPTSVRLSAVAAAVLLAAAVASCDNADGPIAAPTPPSASATGVAAGPTAPADPAYTADGLDLCARKDVKVVADLAPEVTREDPRPPLARPGAACLFEMRTKAGYQANLRVEASALATADEARQLYRGTRRATGMTPAGAVPGVGEEAEAFTKRSSPGFKYAEYMVHARTGNLVVKVWLAVGGESYVANSVLAEKSLIILRATQAAVPTA
ncbi:hypothetical protein [Micromonospora chalcea]|uniref:hypothetical protein n=1 Tax=Micromonospora chalcea TaxID=1874 RepID=UPI0033278108